MILKHEPNHAKMSVSELHHNSRELIIWFGEMIYMNSSLFDTRSNERIRKLT